MLGTSVQFGRQQSDDRFYIPVKARKNQNQHRNHHQNLNKNRNQAQRAKNDGAVSPAASSGNRSRAAAPSDSPQPKEPSKSPPKPPLTCHSNLDRFLESTIPSIPAQYLSKTTVRGWRTCDIVYHPYFTLGDLWESFKEWSAYGAGVPLKLDGSDSVVQYYVPYLSGIQLYVESTKPATKLRDSSDDSEGDSFRDSSSDGSSDYEPEKAIKCYREQWGRSQQTNSLKIGRLSLSEARKTSQEDLSSDDGEAVNSRSQLLFEYLERDTPYSREPLAEKLFDLARQNPKLKTLRSCDLLPNSWISIAWYPIYRIPTGPTLRDLDACFLTYHSLSTPIGGNGNLQSPAIHSDEMDGVPHLFLRPFGLASYKFKGATWMQNGSSEHLLSNSLTQAAENWLKLLQVNHPDFQFFASHGFGR